MPSRLHEDTLRLFQNRPALAAELAREALKAELPEYSPARVDSANLSDLRPAEYRADLVILLTQDRPVHGIVVEVQLGRDDDKEYVWPAYVCNLRSRIRSPVCLLVMTADETMARWASQAIQLGGDNHFRPWVLSPARIPEITGEEQARQRSGPDGGRGQGPYRAGAATADYALWATARERPCSASDRHQRGVGPDRGSSADREHIERGA